MDPAHVASPAPFAFTLILWVGAFSAMVWGMMLLFKPRPRPARPFADDVDERAPGAEDVTLEEPGPDR